MKTPKNFRWEHYIDSGQIQFLKIVTTDIRDKNLKKYFISSHIGLIEDKKFLRSIMSMMDAYALEVLAKYLHNNE